MSLDRFWMTAKFDSICAECENQIVEGERIVYAPDEYKAYCSTCGIDLVGEDE